eukprot:15344772-Ditylum_brightwellii.AAC.1
MSLWSVITTNQVATHWKIYKQLEPTGATTSAELCSAGKDIVKAFDVRHYSTSNGILHHKRVGHISMIPRQTDLMLADPNIKPHGRNNLKTKIDCLVSIKYYPPSGTEPHDLLLNSHEAQIPLKSDTSKSSQSTT